MNRSKIIIIIGIVVVSVLGVCSLTSCGGGGGNGNNESGVILPPISGQPVETLAGKDVNGNSVWDYIEPRIDSYNSEKARMALREYAKNMQSALLDAEDEKLSVQHARDGSYVSGCVDYILGLTESIETRKMLRADILNTDKRSRAYILYNSQLGGYTFTAWSGKASLCNFDVDSLPN